MARPRFRLKLTPAELAELESFLKIKGLPLTPEQIRIRTRANALWYSATQGWSLSEIAGECNVTERTVWRWIKRYRQKGLAGLKSRDFFIKK